MPGVFVFTRTKDDPYTSFRGPFYKYPTGGIPMAEIQIADVVGLQSALSGKAPATHEHDWAQIKGTAPFAALSHTHTIQQVDGLASALENKVDGEGITAIWSGTQADYDALTPDASTLYIVKEA